MHLRAERAEGPDALGMSYGRRQGFPPHQGPDWSQPVCATVHDVISPSRRANRADAGTPRTAPTSPIRVMNPQSVQTMNGVCVAAAFCAPPFSRRLQP
jgi:hypothetical protein